jgi:arylsulfatase A-like enzyme
VVPGLLFAGAFWAHGSLEYAPVPARGTPRGDLPNVVFVTIDTLRADHVGIYGSSVATPTLDRLAREGAYFPWAFSQVPHTTPSHVSMFTSLYPFAHGAKNGVPFRPGLVTLPGLLREAGYHTAAFVSAYTTKSNVTGLGDAFDVYVDSLNPWVDFAADDAVEPLTLYRVLDRTAGNQIPAPVVNARVLDWADGDVERPFFVWVHYFDAHGPFEPLPDYRALYVEPGQSAAERELALDAAEVTNADAQLGRLREALEARGLLENTLVVVTSDHGEAFREPHPRPEHGHGKTLYDAAVHVPLIVWGPGRIPAGGVVRQLTESVDLGPTLLDLIGLAVPASFVGRSMAGPLRGAGEAPGPELVFGQTAMHRGEHWFAIRSPSWKLHVNTDDGAAEELFDLTQDPGETRNVARERADVAERYRRLLGDTIDLEAEGKEAPLDRETYERLKAMGYITE